MRMSDSRQSVKTMKNISWYASYRLKYPHIIRYVDEGTVGVLDDEASERKHWVPFVVMEKADSNLRDYLKRNHSVPYIIYSSPRVMRSVA